MALMDVSKTGVIFYTDSQLDESIARPVRERILQSGLPIVSVSLNKPLDFGKNIVVEGKRGYVSMMRQIIIALENSTAEYVFFCEHDVAYSASHFEFVPPRDDIFYYNANVWRWEIGSNKAIRYDRMLPLSCMCANRKLALRFYRYRMEVMKEAGLDIFNNDQSALMRRWGFEPGTKKKNRGGLTDDDFSTWHSEKPLIDIRHKGTFSPRKTRLSDFKHAPKNFEEIKIKPDEIWTIS